ncbi:hypothetical protein [Gordonia malaquae]|uniref:hypothetical protein n=1 Tax=Gordonia malaquae TaxID=410332 RepID=UPI003016A8F7
MNTNLVPLIAAGIAAGLAACLSALPVASLAVFAIAAPHPRLLALLAACLLAIAAMLLAVTANARTTADLDVPLAATATLAAAIAVFAGAVTTGLPAFIVVMASAAAVDRLGRRVGGWVGHREWWRPLGDVARLFACVGAVGGLLGGLLGALLP